MDECGENDPAHVRTATHDPGTMHRLTLALPPGSPTPKGSDCTSLALILTLNPSIRVLYGQVD